jgi:hypothetical protein
MWYREDRARRSRRRAHTPMTRFLHRSVSIALLASAALSFAGCKSTRDQLHDLLVDRFENDRTWAATLCQYDVYGLRDVTVTAVEYIGPTAGSGTAIVSGTPIVHMGTTAPGPCSGSIGFRYGSVGRSHPTHSARRGRRSTVTYSMQVSELTVTARTGAMPAAAPSALTPVAPTHD